MSLPDVTFETKCYEKDWEILLKTGRLEQMISRNEFDFAARVLYINNVSQPEQVQQWAERLKDRGVITEHILVDDHADAALDFFGLDRSDFKGGYYYSIQELVGVYLCKTDYLLHFSGDSILDGSFGWIDQAVERMSCDSRIKTANCLWNHARDEVHEGTFDPDGRFWVGYGFSDQCYLIPTAEFRKPIFHGVNPASERYPGYGGELFEKRVDAWMRNNSYQRATWMQGSYLHRNFPRNRFVRTLRRLLKLYDGA